MTSSPKTQIALSNQSLVFESFGDTDKLTISEITDKVNTRLKSQEKVPLAERTIRRAIDSLVSNGHIKQFARQGNAITYGRIDAELLGTDKKSHLIPFGGNLLTVEDFLKILVDPSGEPFKLKTSVLSDEVQHKLRKYMAFVVMASEDPGYGDKVDKIRKNLLVHLTELENITNILKSFINSAVWYEQYRDHIARDVRTMHQEDAEFYQLTVDYMRG